MSHWTIFSNHGHVLVCLARDSEARLRDVAADVGLTERAVQKIIRDLQECGMISVSKHGRRNRYRIDHKKNLRHDLEAQCTLGALVDLVAKASTAEMNTGTSESVITKIVDITPTPEAPVADVQVVAEPVGPEPDKPLESGNKSSIERQQGSLF